MSVVIPFVNQLSEQEQSEWLVHLNCKLAPYKVVLPNQMSHQDKLDAKIAIVANPDPSALTPFSNLVWIQSLWAGVDRLLNEMPSSTVKVVRLEDPFLAETMAEAVLTWSLYLHRDIPKYIAQQQSGQWQQHKVVPASMRNIGFLGLGKLGQLSAYRLKNNGFNVSGWSQSPKLLPGITCYSRADGLTNMLANTHILVVLLPLTAETDKLVDQELLAKLPQGANIINFARGKIIDTQALISALDSGQLAHAVLDVFEQEPLPPKSSLWHHKNVTILPHISAPTNITTASEVVSRNLRNYFMHGIMPKIVDIKCGY